jgi:FlaG/FlaF family flagellin (archaellin)
MVSLRKYRRNDQAVSPVIGEVLMVSLAVVLAAVMFLMVSGMFSETDDDKLIVNLSDPIVEQQSRGSTPTKVWDAIFTINKVSPKTKKLVWLEARVAAKDSTGSILHWTTNLTLDDPVSYDNNDTDGITPQFWYIETRTGDDKASTGDAIKITGMDQTWTSASVILTRGGEIVAQINLPSHFE